MNVTLSLDSYKGVDGSSLSETRCNQIVKVYEMLEDMGGKMISYHDIQEEAENRKLFGSTNAKSAIRTFFPLLRKLNFVDYDEMRFPANVCFKSLGIQFVLVCRSLKNLGDNSTNKLELENKLLRIKRNIIKLGIIKMHDNGNYKSHNVWIALKLFEKLNYVYWSEFLYTLHCLEEQFSIEKAVDKILSNREQIKTISFISESGDLLPTTCYTYIRGLLTEAGIIDNIDSVQSKINDEGVEFLKELNL